MIIRFLESAQVEFDEAVDYYNYESPGFGDEFLQEVLNSLDRIAQFPEAWNPLSKRTRRYLVKRFHYGVIYTTTDEIILYNSCGKLASQTRLLEKQIIRNRIGVTKLRDTGIELKYKIRACLNQAKKALRFWLHYHAQALLSHGKDRRRNKVSGRNARPEEIHAKRDFTAAWDG